MHVSGLAVKFRFVKKLCLVSDVLDKQWKSGLASARIMIKVITNKPWSYIKIVPTVLSDKYHVYWYTFSPKKHIVITLQLTSRTWCRVCAQACRTLVGLGTNFIIGVEGKGYWEWCDADQTCCDVAIKSCDKALAVTAPELGDIYMTSLMDIIRWLNYIDWLLPVDMNDIAIRYISFLHAFHRQLGA